MKGGEVRGTAAAPWGTQDVAADVVGLQAGGFRIWREQDDRGDQSPGGGRSRRARPRKAERSC